MRPATLLAALLAAGPAGTLACLQLSCPMEWFCADSAAAALDYACGKLVGNFMVDGQPLVGRDGCGWHGEPQWVDASAASAQQSCKGKSGLVAQGDLAVWRARDNGKVRDGLANAQWVGPNSDAKFGPCTVRKTVDC